MKINFRKLVVKPSILDDTVSLELDIHAQFADIIYKNASGLVAVNLALKVLNSEEVEVNDEELSLIKLCASLCVAPIARAISELN